MPAKINGMPGSAGTIAQTRPATISAAAITLSRMCTMERYPLPMRAAFECPTAPPLFRDEGENCGQALQCCRAETTGVGTDIDRLLAYGLLGACLPCRIYCLSTTTRIF